MQHLHVNFYNIYTQSLTKEGELSLKGWLVGFYHQREIKLNMLS
jgi:hypothetical protein